MVAKTLKKLVQSIKQSKLMEVSRRLILPGFDGMPIYDVAIFFAAGLQKGYLVTRASALSFKFFLALFPAIIFLFTLIPFIPIPNFQEELMAILVEVLPSNVYEITQSTLDDLVNNQRGGLLSIGFLVTIYFATNGIDALFNAFNESVHVIVKTGLWKRKLSALLTLIILTVLVVFAIGLIIGSEIGVAYFLKNHDNISVYLLQAGKWIIIIALYFFTFSFLYYLGSNKNHRWRFISAGSTLASTLSLLLSLGFSYYVNNFGQYNKLYGSLGTLIVVLLWIYVNSLVLLIGYELNTSIHQAQRSRQV